MNYSSPFASGPPPAESGGPAAAAAVEPSHSPSRSRPAVLAGVLALLVVGAGAAGAVVAHEVWTGSPASTASVTEAAAPSTPATPQTPSVPSSSPGGSGSFGGSGSGSAGGSSSSVPSVTPNGRGGFSINIGGTTISVGPNGVHFGNGGSSSARATGPANSSALTAKVSPALVDINTRYSYAGGAGAGTGIVVTSDGRVLTNNHVIAGATQISATDIGNGKTYTATVVGYDPSDDIAVLQLQGASGLTTANLGSSAGLSVGNKVLGVGNAGGVGGAPSSVGGSITGLDKSITAGDAIGGRSERLSGLIQTNAAVEPGDSGGPLVDSQGRVIGLVTAGSASAGFGLGFGSQAASQAYAVPIDTAQSVAAQIVAGKGSATVHVGPSAFIGIQVGSAGFGGFGSGSSNSGVTVGGVVSGQPAAKAGLAAGDVITAIDGSSVSSAEDLSSLLLGHHPGDTIKITWTSSAGQPHTASLKLASGPPA